VKRGKTSPIVVKTGGAKHLSSGAIDQLAGLMLSDAISSGAPYEPEKCADRERNGRVGDARQSMAPLPQVKMVLQADAQAFYKAGLHKQSLATAKEGCRFDSTPRQYRGGAREESNCRQDVWRKAPNTPTLRKVYISSIVLSVTQNAVPGRPPRGRRCERVQLSSRRAARSTQHTSHTAAGQSARRCIPTELIRQ
jgi:hypothetical protein